MKILVVGGAGYIGSHMVYELLENGYDPIIFDNLSTGHQLAIPAVRLVKGDLADKHALNLLFSEYSFDAVMHFASSIQVGESVSNPLKYYQNNVANTLNLLEAMELANVRRIVFSSTAAVYGNPVEIPVTELSLLQPENPYGRSKLMVENILADCSRAWGLKSAILRYFNAAGAHPSGKIGEDHEPESHLIPLILQVALGKRKSITINGSDYNTPDGTCIRDYIHVCDLARAHTLALQALMDNNNNMIYNLGNGLGYSIKDVLDVCRKITGHSISEEYGERRDGDPAILVASSQKIMSDLCWNPKYGSLEDIVSSAWKWHTSHQ